MRIIPTEKDQMHLIHSGRMDEGNVLSREYSLRAERPVMGSRTDHLMTRDCQPVVTFDKDSHSCYSSTHLEMLRISRRPTHHIGTLTESETRYKYLATLPSSTTSQHLSPLFTDHVQHRHRATEAAQRRIHCWPLYWT